MFKYLSSTSVLAGALFVVAPAMAQEPAVAEDSGIADIVVTAQRRDESVQKVALSIEVFSGDTLQDRGIARPDDLTKLAPGIQVGGGATTQIYIRGVGDFGVVATANPAVVTSLNGVAIARPQAISGNFFDLERVEIPERSARDTVWTQCQRWGAQPDRGKAEIWRNIRLCPGDLWQLQCVWQ